MAGGKSKAKYRSGGMVSQMSKQRGVSPTKAGDLMKKAKKMNRGGMSSYSTPGPGTGGYEMNRGFSNSMRRNMGGTVMVLSLGEMPSMKQICPDSYEDEDKSLIQSTENQVRARHFNNNGGKGTF